MVGIIELCIEQSGMLLAEILGIVDTCIQQVFIAFTDLAGELVSIIDIHGDICETLISETAYVLANCSCK
jgi:hypothetical protein